MQSAQKQNVQKKQSVQKKEGVQKIKVCKKSKSKVCQMFVQLSLIFGDLLTFTCFVHL